MKILTLSCVPLLPYLGSGYTRLNWTNGLRSLGHQVDVLQSDDFQFLPILQKGKKYRLAIGILFKVLKVLKHSQYDIIEFYGDEYWLLLIWLQLFKNQRPILIAHVDGLELLDFEKEQEYWNRRKGLKLFIDNNSRRRVSKINFRLSDKFICGCIDDLDYVINKKIFDSSNAFCVPPGIDESYHSLNFIDKKENIIIFLGSWINRKGIKIIPAVISKVLSKNKDYQFHIYGAWHNKKQIFEEFDSSIKEKITVFEKLPTEILLEGIAKSSIFFFPTYSEGFGLATVEAMSCSCAVVTTMTGIGSLLKHNEEAVICNFDEVDEMVNAINNLIQNNSFRHKIAFGGFQKAKEFKWTNQVKLLETLYKDFLVSSKKQ